MSTVICKPTGNDKGNDNDKDKDKAKDNDKDKDRSRSPPARGRRLNIVIRIRDGGIGSRIPNRDFTVSVEASATVDDVKAQIYAEKGLRHNDQMLYLPRLGDRLEDGRTLSDYSTSFDLLLFLLSSSTLPLTPYYIFIYHTILSPLF